jgi:CRP/FNR family transcriptional regulator, anaerobic regulatory protein
VECLASLTSRSPIRTALAERNFRTASLRSEFSHRPTILYPAGQRIFWEDDQANSIFLVADGVLRISRFLMDGRRGVIGFVFPGDIMGLSARTRHIYSAEAVTNCYIYALPREKLNTLLADSLVLREEFISELCAEVSRTQSLVLNLSQKSAEERVASFILELVPRGERKSAGKVEVRMPMSRLDIADYLGLTVETVCRSLAKLKKAGHIRTVGRDIVLIERLADLKDFACADGVC